MESQQNETAPDEVPLRRGLIFRDFFRIQYSKQAVIGAVTRKKWSSAEKLTHFRVTSLYAYIITYLAGWMY
jgi:hypothetical protein